MRGGGSLVGKRDQSEEGGTDTTQGIGYEARAVRRSEEASCSWKCSGPSRKIKRSSPVSLKGRKLKLGGNRGKEEGQAREVLSFAYITDGPESDGGKADSPA